MSEDAGVGVACTTRLAAGASGTIPLHVFSSITGTPAKPQFGANLSIGDQAACDVTANSGNRSNVLFTDGAVTVSGEPRPCVGDCGNDGSVAINELIIGVNIALGSRPIGDCPEFDANSSGMIEINELIQGVNNALNGCPA